MNTETLYEAVAHLGMSSLELNHLVWGNGILSGDANELDDLIDNADAELSDAIIAWRNGYRADAREYLEAAISSVDRAYPICRRSRAISKSPVFSHLKKARDIMERADAGR